MATRRRFLKTVAVGSVGLGVLAMTGCGDDSTGTDSGTATDTGTADTGTADTGTADTGTADTGTAACTGTTTNISANHGHAVDVPGSDVAAGAQVVYDIQGTASHTHDLTVAAADFTTLQGGGPVTITSSLSNGHTHAVTISCA